MPRIALNNLQKIVLIFLISRIILVLSGLYIKSGQNIVRRYDYTNEIGYFGKIGTLFHASDTVWYFSIADNGYPKVSFDQLKKVTTPLAFYPLYPLTIKLLSFAIGDVWAGILISNLSLLFAAIFLYFALKISNESLAYNSAKFLLLFPTSYIFSTILSEPLFLFLFILQFYFLETKKFLSAGVSGLLLSLIRVIGFLSFLPILFAVWPKFSKANKTQKLRLNLATFMPIFGVMALAFYYKYLTGNYLGLLFFQAGWNKGFSGNLLLISHFIFGQLIQPVYLLSFIFTLLIIVNLANGINFLNKGYKLMIAITVLTYIFTTTQDWHVLSFTRFFAILFPAYIGAGKWATSHRFFGLVVSIGFLILQCFLFAIWTLGAPIMI